MDRLAGGQSQDEKFNPKTFPFQLIGPYGIAIDSKGLVYVADQRVGAIFIFNTENPRYAAHPERLRRPTSAGSTASPSMTTTGSLSPTAKCTASSSSIPSTRWRTRSPRGWWIPVGLAIDTTNRFLYVVDTQQDQVIVYDADTLKLLRRIGTGGKTHYLTTPGDFGAPQGVAVDGDGNVYVTDTLNNRVEIFDADGNFISQFGKAGDGPGYFARPKGIAVDSDGHIWVADDMQDRLQVFNREGQLLTYIGSGHGELPGQFKALVGVAIDKQNRVFTTEQEPGRLQVFRYVTDADAAAEKTRREEELQKAADQRQKAAAQAQPEKPAEVAPRKTPDAPPPSDAQSKPGAPPKPSAP